MLEMYFGLVIIYRKIRRILFFGETPPGHDQVIIASTTRTGESWVRIRLWQAIIAGRPCDEVLPKSHNLKVHFHKMFSGIFNLTNNAILSLGLVLIYLLCLLKTSIKSFHSKPTHHRGACFISKVKQRCFEPPQRFFGSISASGRIQQIK